MTGLRSWPALLRLAWRDVLRNKGRSALILVMIALPVLGVTAAHVSVSTQDVDTVEGLDRRLGQADASLHREFGASRVYQGVDPQDGGGWGSEDGERPVPATPEQIVAILGDSARLVPSREDYLSRRDGDRLSGVRVISADLREPIFAGTWHLGSGRVPEKVGEVLVNSELVDHGVSLGDTFELYGESTPLKVVGTAEDASYNGEATAWALPGTVPAAANRLDDYLVDVKGGVSWQQVRALNELGVSVFSRAVVADPPSDEELRAGQEDMYFDDYDSQMILATTILIITMALLEVILLAGPAFAVGARRMQRHLAQVAATGGTPAQVRKAVLATAVVLGGIAAAVGLVGGIGLAAVATPILQHWSSSTFGPFDVRWAQVIGIAFLGWLSAVIAAFVPAWIASRQDVVRVLAGRRGDRAPGKASPLVGLVLFLAGVGVAAYGTRQPTWGEVWIAGAAILVVLGGILLLSPVVVLVGRLAGRAPLPLRYAVRDAARHRTRTIPAIGAVMATVTGVVALGIANSSDIDQQRETYRPQTAAGAGFVTNYTDSVPDELRAELWQKVVETTKESVPAAEPLQSFEGSDGIDEPLTEVQLRGAGEGRGDYLSEYGGYFGNWLVADTLPPVEMWLTPAGKNKVSAALDAGKVVLFTDKAAQRNAAQAAKEGYGQPLDLDRDEVTLGTWTYDEYGQGKDGPESVTAPAVVVEVEHGTTQGIVPTAVAERLGVPLATRAIALPGPISKAREKALEKALTAAGVPEADVYVERGWTGGRDYLLMLLALAGVGALLMIGGTLTATFLALSDASPDLATLSAVGAAPRERRLVAASTALVLGGIGAVLGAAVGFVPGVTAAWVISSDYWTEGTWDGVGAAHHYLDIPWLLILGVVVGLPLLTALVVGLSARSRLPLVARID